MKQYIIGFSLFLLSLQLSYADFEAQKQALQAEASRHDAEVLTLNAQCSSFIIGSAQDTQCHQEKARLDAWMASILARARALTANANTNTSASYQLKAAAKEARRDNSDFRKNFDEGGAQSDGSLAVDGRGSKQDPVVPPRLMNDPKVLSAVTKRDAARSDIRQIETQLKALSPTNPKDQVQIAQLRDKKQRDEREVQYENHSIADKIGTHPSGKR
jgi:hypothetical protein